MIFLLLLFFIGIALGLTWFLVFHDRGEREPVGALWLALGFGFLGIFPTMFLERTVLHVRADAAVPAGLLTMLGIGAVEEICKFVPLAFFIYKRRYFNEHTDGVIYFALAGVGFGLPENILYTLSYGTQAGIGRVILTPIFHAATTALVGYFLVKLKLDRRRVGWILVPLAAAISLHGLYDFGLSSAHIPLKILAFCITFGLSGALFVIYLKATTLDQEMGLSAVGHNAFCRSCGQPNPRHYLYCTHCGKYA